MISCQVKEWVVGKDEKDQFSPVSVLESPFRGGDGDDINTSPTNSDSNLVQNKGNYHHGTLCFLLPYFHLRTHIMGHIYVLQHKLT